MLAVNFKVLRSGFTSKTLFFFLRSFLLRVSNEQVHLGLWFLFSSGRLYFLDENKLGDDFIENFLLKSIDFMSDALPKAFGQKGLNVSRHTRFVTLRLFRRQVVVKKALKNFDSLIQMCSVRQTLRGALHCY